MGRVNYTVAPGGSLRGTLRVPGDKSISHRAVILGALAEGETRVSGLLEGEDVLATLAAFRAMGIQADGPSGGELTIHGAGLAGLSAPQRPLWLGNSGTAMRLLAGVMAGQAFDSVLEGDASLSTRPMGRVTTPLAEMGAHVSASSAGTPPLSFSGRGGGAPLRGIHYHTPVASAQVKSCVLLAGLYAAGETCVSEPADTRDHTERMLSAFGRAVGARGRTLCVTGGAPLRATQVQVPADISSAAFFMVGAAISPGSDLLLTEVGVNPTRTGVIDILRAMGADIGVDNRRMFGGEPVADIRVRASRLHGIDIPVALVPLAIDEFPAIFVAAACAHGNTRLSGAAELRVKESDRIAAMADGLDVLGIHTEPSADGICIHGGRLAHGRVRSQGDHRVAMALSVAALAASGGVVIEDCAAVDTSFPAYVDCARGAGLGIECLTRS